MGLLSPQVVPAHLAVFGNRFLLVAEPDEARRDVQPVVVTEHFPEMAAGVFVLMRPRGVSFDRASSSVGDTISIFPILAR